MSGGPLRLPSSEESLAVSIVTTFHACSRSLAGAGRPGEADSCGRHGGPGCGTVLPRVHGAVYAPRAPPLLLPQLLQTVPGADLSGPELHPRQRTVLLPSV